MRRKSRGSDKKCRVFLSGEAFSVFGHFSLNVLKGALFLPLCWKSLQGVRASLQLKLTCPSPPRRAVKTLKHSHKKKHGTREL